MEDNVVIKVSGLQVVANTGDNVEVMAMGKPVSYTHLDVYKRQESKHMCLSL